MESQRDVQVAKIQCRKFLRFCRDWVCSTWRKGGFAGARNSLLRSKMKLPREESLVLAVHDRRRDKLKLITGQEGLQNLVKVLRNMSLMLTLF